MEALLHNLSEVIAVSIIHSLWQCLLVYLVLRIIMADIIRFSAAAKYNISVAALFAATAWFIYTLFDQAGHYTWDISLQQSVNNQQHLPLITTLRQITRASDRYEVTIEHYLPYISIVYVIGLVFHSLRLTSAWMQMQQLKQSITVDSQLQKKLDELSALLNIKRKVIASYAGRIDVPCITGYLKPLIMLPVTLGTYLSAKEIETILLHELAHAKRNDYLINLLQQVISVSLFFNPFVMLMNRIINRERENSCDDMVVTITGQPLVYAQALLKIEQNNATQLPLALAATGKKYHLLNRIERIMKTKKPTTNIRHLVLAFTILMGSISSIAWLNPAIGHGKLSVKKIKPAVETLFAADTTVKKQSKPAKYSKAGEKPRRSQGRMTSNGFTRDGVTYYSYGMQDPKLEEMGRQMEKYGKIVDQYYNSPDFKRLSADMEQLGKKMEAYYNAPEYKKLAEDLEQKGKDMEAYYNSPAIKKLQADQERVGREFAEAYGDNAVGEKLGKEMESRGKILETYYNSKDFKDLYTRLMKKYNIKENATYVTTGQDSDDPNYRKYQQELSDNIPADVKKAKTEMKKFGDEMRAYYQSPERKSKTNQMRAMGDSARAAFNNAQTKKMQDDMRRMGEQMRNYTQNPEMKNSQEQMRELGKQMHAYTNNPEIKRVQDKMRQLGDEMRAYTNSPEFKKRAEEWKKNMKASNWNFNYNNAETDEVPAILAAPPVAAPSVPDVQPAPAEPALAPAKP